MLKPAQIQAKFIFHQSKSSRIMKELNQKLEIGSIRKSICQAGLALLGMWEEIGDHRALLGMGRTWHCLVHALT